MRFDDSIYYFHVPVNVLELDIDADMKLVYMVLCSFTNSKTDLCYPSVKTIAKKAGLSVRQTMRAIKKLVGAGLIEIIEKGVGRGHKNVYKVIVPGKSENKKSKEEKKSENILPSGLSNKLKTFGFSENDDDMRKIEDIYMQKGEEYVRSAIEYTKKHAKTNKRAYLLQALEKDWAKDEREKMEKQNAFERAKQEYKKLIGKTVLIDGKEYRISDDGVISDKDAIPSGYIWEDWNYWKPVLLKNLKGQPFLKTDGT